MPPPPDDPFAPGREAPAELAPALLRRLYRDMLRCRRLEERIAELAEAREILTPVHLYLGQEAVAAGCCAALGKDDFIFGTHRSHGHYLCKGGALRPMVAEFFGKASGCSHGRGGSMHLIAIEYGLRGTTPIVASSIPMAAGAALACKARGDRRIAMTFFGDGAMEEGVFYETLNLAAVWNLPLVFVCENNFYSSHLPLRMRRKMDNLFEYARPFGVPSARLDGTNVMEVYRHAAAAVEHARAGRGPTFLECRTYRWRGHVGPAWEWELGIRQPEEVREWLARCPLKALAGHLTAHGLTRPGELEAIQREMDEEIEEAVRFARQAPYPAADTMLRGVFAPTGHQEGG
jgi:pyruvate dehydrogenase E1 component alpha subunit